MEYREWLTPLTYNHLFGMAILTNTKEIITIAYGVQRIVDPTDSQSFVWHGQIEKYQRNFTHQSNCDGSLAHKKRGKIPKACTLFSYFFLRKIKIENEVDEHSCQKCLLGNLVF